MKRHTALATLRNFPYTHPAATHEDITEWFSDNDTYLADIVRERRQHILL